MKKPWPKLSEQLTGTKCPGKCQKCGTIADVHGWIEGNDTDAPTSTVLFLCLTCSGEVIEKHPRFYHEMPHNEPRPGAMQICADCIHRRDLRCACPAAAANGGAGIKITYSKPTVCFMDGTDKAGRRRGWREIIYGKAPRPCTGREDSMNVTRRAGEA